MAPCIAIQHASFLYALICILVAVSDGPRRGGGSMRGGNGPRRAEQHLHRIAENRRHHHTPLQRDRRQQRHYHRKRPRD